MTVGDDVFIIGGQDLSVYKLSGGNWSEFSNLQTPRYHHMCSVLNGTIYVMGGFDGVNCLTSVELLTPGSNEWVAGPTLRGHVAWGQPLLHNNTVFVMAGQGTYGISNTDIYRLNGDNWEIEEVSLSSPGRSVFPAPLL